MKRSRILPLLLMLTMVGMLVFLVQKTRAVNDRGFGQLLGTLRDLKQIDAELNVDVLRSLAGNQQHAEPVASPVVLIDAVERALRDSDSGDDLGQQRATADLITLLADFKRAMNLKIARIERFKAQQQALRDALHGMPNAVAALRAPDAQSRLGARQQAELEQLTALLLTDSMTYRVLGDETVRKRLEQATAQLEQMTLPASLNQPAQQLAAHARTILWRQQIGSDLIAAIGALPTARLLDQLNDACSREYRLRLGAQRTYSRLLIAYSCMLLTLLLYFGWRSFSAYRRLRQTLRHLQSTNMQLVESQTQLQRAHAQVQAASLAKSDFLANMSHEIRTPMNSILGMAHLALRSSLPPKLHDYLSKILTSGQHMLAIVNDILDFSKIEAGMLRLEAVGFDLDQVINTVVTQTQPKAQAKNLQLAVKLDAGFSRQLCGDPLRLSQVLINLVDNAIKFTPAGTIELSVECVQQDERALQLRFEVKDSGIGIEADALADLFQSFHQADSSTTRCFGGTGLGLAICKSLIEQMGGIIAVDSAPGQGSRFWFTVSLNKSAQAAPMGSAHYFSAEIASNDPAPNLAWFKNVRILLVEDNLFNQQVACELLQDVGVIVTIAENGAVALDKLANATFDCVLMDMQMPVMDGLEATRRIRATPALRDLKVIAMSANARGEDRARCLDAGIDNFISKPVMPAQMYAVIARYLRGNRTFQDFADVGQRPLPLPGAANPFAAETAVPLASASAADDCIDLRVLAQAFNNNPEKIRKFALRYLPICEQQVDEVEAVLARAAFTELAALGHRNKSSARSVGAARLADLWQQLEHLNPAERQQASAIIHQLRPLLEQIRARILSEFAVIAG